MFGESNEENVEETSAQGQVLLPATVVTPGGLYENKIAQADDPSMHASQREQQRQAA